MVQVIEAGGETYRAEISRVAAIPGKPWTAMLFRKYPMCPGAEPAFFAVAYQACATKAQAEAYLEAEIAQGRLFFGQYKAAA
jgi:hypothetical protein